MNKFFKITLCVLSILFNQSTLSKTVNTRTTKTTTPLYTLRRTSTSTLSECEKQDLFQINADKNLILIKPATPVLTETRTHTLALSEHCKEAPIQIAADNTIFVNSTPDCDNILIVFYEGKVKAYYGHIPQEETPKLQDLFDVVDKNDFHFYSDLSDPLFHAPEIKFDGMYYSNPERCFINAEKSIEIEDSLIETPHVLLKTENLEIWSFLIGTQTIELQSNNPYSLLSSIKFTLKDKNDLQAIIIADVDFKYNFVALICSSASKVELQCLPESFYLDENAICFK